MPRGERCPGEHVKEKGTPKGGSLMLSPMLELFLSSPHSSLNRQEVLDQIKHLEGLGIGLSIFESNPNFLNNKDSPAK